MVGERRHQYAEDDRRRPPEPRREQHREELRLVADPGERDHRGRGEPDFHEKLRRRAARDSNGHHTRRPARTKVPSYWTPTISTPASNEPRSRHSSDTLRAGTEGVSNER